MDAEDAESILSSFIALTGTKVAISRDEQRCSSIIIPRHPSIIIPRAPLPRCTRSLHMHRTQY
eukprot:6282945-Prymnesium_polylepis.1